MILMIDNYDSFTYNLVQYLGELDQEVKVYRNDEITLKEIEKMHPQSIVISPGPCTPNEAGISLQIVTHFKSTIPILGVCLGHQSIAQAFGGTIIRAGKIMHGKTSQIYHSSHDIFNDLESPYTATRYHSLVVEKQSFPDCLEITAWTQNDEDTIDEIMGFCHRQYPISAVQFHPESILTAYGHQLLKNFIIKSHGN